MTTDKDLLDVHVMSDAHDAQIRVRDMEIEALKKSVKFWKREHDNLLSEIKTIIDDFKK